MLLFLLPLLLLPASWAADLPRPEHPRPDFERLLWQNLNGTWEFEIDNENTGVSRGLMAGHDLQGRIVVPFCPESKLSGVGNTDFMTHVWYRRLFDLPAPMRGHRILLHFGAVDWEARVWLNGTYLARIIHEGSPRPARAAG
jgi:beta-galactosidase/beta-glucuronidase